MATRDHSWTCPAFPGCLPDPGAGDQPPPEAPERTPASNSAPGGQKTVSLLFYLFSGLIALLLILFVWSVRSTRRRVPPSTRAEIPDDDGRRHMTYLSQIRQALAATDYEFLSKRASKELVRRVHRGRQGVALGYLGALRRDFQRLLRIARGVSAMASQVAAVHRLERVRLTA